MAIYVLKLSLQNWFGSLETYGWVLQICPFSLPIPPSVLFIFNLCIFMHDIPLPTVEKAALKLLITSVS